MTDITTDPKNYHLEQKIEIYKVMVESAERAIERRMRANQFYYSLTAAIFVVYSYINNVNFERAESARESVSRLWMSVPSWALPLLLIIVSMSWFSLLLSFRSLSAAKYTVISEMEKELPFQPFEREWHLYKKKRKVEVTMLELAVPFLFYLAAAAGIWVALFGMGR